MLLKVNCKYNDKGAWCTNKNIERSLFGIGARCCVEHNDGICELKEKPPKGAPPPLAIVSDIKRKNYGKRKKT